MSLFLLQCDRTIPWTDIFLLFCIHSSNEGNSFLPQCKHTNGYEAIDHLILSSMYTIEINCTKGSLLQSKWHTVWHSWFSACTKSRGKKKISLIPLSVYTQKGKAQKKATIRVSVSCFTLADYNDFKIKIKLLGVVSNPFHPPLYNNE